MRPNEATAFENEYFFCKKGNLKVRKVLKSNFPTGLRPRIGKKSRQIKPKPKKTPVNGNRFSRTHRVEQESWVEARTSTDDFDNNDSWEDDDSDSVEPNYDSQTEWCYGDPHNDAGND